MDLDDEFLRKTRAFETWLTKAGIQLNKSIKIADLRSVGKGRGAVATSNIPSGEILFTIPRAALLTPDNIALATTCPSIANAPQLDDPWTSLLLALLLETSRADSQWQPYLHILPTKTQFNTLMFWSETELEELQASGIRDKIGKPGAEQTFRALMPLVLENRKVFGFDQIPDAELEQVLIQRCHVLASLIMAYAFDVEVFPKKSQPDDDGYVTDEEESDLPKAMVPMADLLNADANLNNARLFYEADGMLEMRSVVDIKEGSEIFNDYGPLPRSELVRRYGYVTNNYMQYDLVDVPLSLFVQQARTSFKAKEDALPTQLASMLECEAEEVPDGFELSTSDVETLESGDTREIHEIFPVLHLMHRQDIFPDTNAIDQKLPYLANVLLQRLAQYQTTIEEDQAILKQQQSELDSRFLMAIEIRLGEKNILRRAIDALTHQTSEPPRKKQRR